MSRATVLPGLLALIASASAACGADPAPSSVHGSRNGGGAGTGAASASTSASGGTTPASKNVPATTGGERASSGGVTGPASNTLAGGGGAHSSGSVAGGGPPSSGGSAAGALGSAPAFRERCHAGAADACAHCVCEQCAAEAEACEQRVGCAQIAACVLETGCDGAACFCGGADTLRCLSGAANGPCRDVILSAPGARSPTLDAPSAGPASDAAVSLGACTRPPSGACASECS